MVNRSQRRNNIGSYPPVKPPHFFKLITPSVVRNRKLRIPGKFSSTHRMNLGKLVFLKVPSGATWTVELVNSNGEVWLCNGWKEFAEYYSIRFGHFLVFRYEGNSNFHVLIFDMTASEIEYPFHGEQSNMKPNGNLRESETEDMEVDDSVQILDDFPTCQTKNEEIPGRNEIEKDVSIEILDEIPRCRMRKPTSNRADNEKDASVEISEDPPTCRNRRETKLVPDLTSCEMTRTKVTFKMHNNCNLQEFSPDIQSRRIQTRGSKHANPKMDVKLHLKRASKEEFTGGAIQSQIPLSTSTDRIFIALQRARAFTSKNPFFVVSMRPSYISTKYGLNIPKDFAKKYLNGEQNNVITLRISEGRTWTVKRYSTTTSGKCTLGWSSFVRDNNLKVGDVCAFELVKGIELTLNATIFRAGEYQNDDRKDKLVI